MLFGIVFKAESDMVDGRHSPPLRSRTMDAAGGMPVLTAKEKPPINVVGDVGGRIAIMVVSSDWFKKKMKTFFFFLNFFF